MSALTKVWKTRVELRGLLASVICGLEWRHHGIGVLQAYLDEGRDPETRVHIWHPDLVKDGMEMNGDVHDYRFDLVSHVVHGVVVHEEWFAKESESGAFEMLQLTHARAAADTKFHGPTEPLPGTFDVSVNTLYVNPGYSYSFPAGHFHRSPVTGLAITLVEKHAQRPVSARLLYQIANRPIMAFGHDIDHQLIGRVLSDAVAALSEPGESEE